MIDVICPIKYGTPVTWHANLMNWYRELPIARLLIGDGGSVEDDTFQVLEHCPRVEVINQHDHFSQGYSIQDLVSRVESPWFVYLHADVQLAAGWYAEMCRHQDQYDWMECERWMVELDTGRCYCAHQQNSADRPYSGSQMGRLAAFKPFLGKIGDDYLFRNEDFIFRALVEEHGGKYGRVMSARHYHQLGGHGTATKQPDVYGNFTRGIVKYCQPNEFLIEGVAAGVRQLPEGYDGATLLADVAKLNPVWLETVEAEWAKRSS